MTNTRRNSIVLGALLIIMGSLTMAMIRNLNQKIDSVKSENKKTESDIKVLQRQISNIDSLIAEYEFRKAMVLQQSKVVLADDSPTITYQYLLRLLNWMGRDIVFNFASSDKGKKQTSWNEYVISGRSNYYDVVSLTRNIEHQRALITIEELSISAEGVANSDTVSYSMVIRTHYNEGGVDASQITPKNIKTSVPLYQLFKPRVWDSPLFPEDDPSLVNIDTSTLIGISENRIFLRDKGGVIHIIAIKDKVLGGYLYSIDLRGGKAVFKVDKYGIPENQILNLTKE
jgi:hypothetical protein